MSRIAVALIVVLIAAVVSPGCGGRWIPNVAARIQATAIGKSPLLFRRLVNRARTLGYAVDHVDRKRKYFRVVANLTSVIAGHELEERVSHFVVFVQPNGDVVMKATGYHVREGETVMHTRLGAELFALASELESEVDLSQATVRAH